MRNRPKHSAFLVSLAAGLCAILLCLAGPARTAEARIYDALLRFRPAGALPTELLLVELGEETGPAEWDGEGLAEGLSSLSAMGARYAAFSAPIALEGSGSVEELSASINEEFATIDANVGGLFDAIRLGSLPAKDAPRFVAGLLQSIDEGKLRLLDAVSGAGSGQRARLSGALKLFGRAYLTVDPGSGGAYGADRPLEGARGRGFSRITPDPDGAWRRIALHSSRGELTAFAALMDRLGGPALVLGPDSLLVRGAAIVGAKRDIEIPLSRGGLLIAWPRKGSGFPRRLAWGELAREALLQRELAAALDDLRRAGLLGPEAGALPGLRDYAAVLGEESLSRGRLDPGWYDAQERYLALAGHSIDAAAEERALAAAQASARGLDEASVKAAFAGARETFAELGRLRRALRAALSGSFCLVAPAAASPELRPTPFGDQASEGLAQAAALGSILSRNFMRELPPWLGFALGAALAAATSVAAAWLGKRWAFVEGAILAVAGAALCVALFLGTGAYLSPLPALLGPAAAAIAAAIPWPKASEPEATKDGTARPLIIDATDEPRAE